jgi:hypothetical protein
MTRTIVDVSMNIMMPESNNVLSVTSNVPNVLMEILVQNVPETDWNQITSVKLVKKDYMMTVSQSIVNYVQTNGTHTVLLVMLPNVLNVLKTEISQTVLVQQDGLKLTEYVMNVTTIVKLVPLLPVLVPNVKIQEFKK